MPNRPNVAPLAAPRLARLLVLTILTCAAGCTRFQILNATVPAWGYSTTPNLSYGDLPRQKLDVYRPGRPQPNAPVVIFFYGGGWQAGQRDEYRFVAEGLTSYGYVTVIPDYRLYPDVTFPAFVEDAAKSVRWVQDNAHRFGGDGGRIYLVGHSAGAHIAALLTLDERYLSAAGVDRSTIRATAGLAGPYDFRPNTADFMGVFNVTDPDKAPDLSFNPIRFVDGREPPILLIQGTADGLVEPANALRLARAIRAAGGTVRHLSYRGGSHSDNVLSFAWSFRWLTPALRDTVSFFQAHP